MNNDQLYFYNRGFNDCLAKHLDSSTVKELTDEEIRALWNPMPDTRVYVRDLLEFARAILKKARE
jgi:hypothetical protein